MTKVSRINLGFQRKSMLEICKYIFITLWLKWIAFVFFEQIYFSDFRHEKWQWSHINQLVNANGESQMMLFATFLNIIFTKLML
jgi:hypothetical protein